MKSMLHEPSLGPIVGHTTSSSARIWIRGLDGDESSRSIGVAALFKNGRYVANTARYFRLRREFDRTGITDFEGLDANTEYTVRLGCTLVNHHNDEEVDQDDAVFSKLPPVKAWVGDLRKLSAETSLARFSTFEHTVESGFSFLFGSCRYPGFIFDRKRSDRIFKSMTAECSKEHADPARFVLMVGDQIYADLLGKAIPIGRAETPKEFHDRYNDAFSTPHMRRLMSNTPTYMMLDDHEIEDNWVAGRVQKDPHKRTLFLMSMAAYASYQWLHGPQTYGRRLFYSFNYGGYPFFVLDERTSRIRDDDDKILEDNHLLGRPAKNAQYQGQVDLFCDWLIAQQKAVGNLPKFVVSPSVFAPNSVEALKDKGKYRDDAWAAFPTTRRQVLQTIVNNHIQNVVFLSGDIHCSNCASINFKSEKAGIRALRAYDITSSALYWPFPFADGDPLDYVHDSEAEGDGFDVFEDGSVIMHYTTKNFEQEDNYSRVDVSEKQIEVQTFGRKGESLGTTILPL